MAETLVTEIIAPAVLVVLSPTLVMLGKRLVAWAEEKFQGKTKWCLLRRQFRNRRQHEA